MNLPTTDEILDDLEFLDDWEQRYQYIIDLGKALPGLPEEQHKEEYLVRGCQSNVWLISEEKGGKLLFHVDSDAVIVQGLLTLVMAAYHDKTAEQILAFDIDQYFNQLDLENHITPTRGNGLRAIVGKIQQLAKNASA
ncbi:Fe-S cluster assembly protein SufE [Idiomarina sp. WRN-38]|jgi:cysteine desulfuration protein SufE|uniref:Fe-S cluster assembly protein SufE n=1 Tax=Idiomarina piscisalsi TaxID=1096243 RepID=A0A432YS38_9GAMM|nr:MULTISPECIES: SufE family protein [Idiomarina]KTG28826.1 Fe-S cluster assembly protein SufE [Idiomarina sp. H105]OAF09591.1 Fe-S cluster assembly protein SufE [Idiomarina sp. WRN-38]MCJ8317305.1 SufE family protein [Idiomarina sp.]NQZ16921.1 SufE family protein [Idiomarina sp.]RUO64483.1 Fe-S cluster assembly protein SufE [Idiomarina piscisalsi]